MSDVRRRSDAELVSQIREALDAPVLAADVVERLAAARRRAVASADRPVVRAPSRWVPVGALATTLLVVGLTAGIHHKSAVPVDAQQLATVEDMDLLMDLEFVAWLDSDNVDAG